MKLTPSNSDRLFNFYIESVGAMLRPHDIDVQNVSKIIAEAMGKVLSRESGEEDGGTYTNLLVSAHDPLTFWVSIDPKLRDLKGTRMVVTCQGEDELERLPSAFRFQ